MTDSKLFAEQLGKPYARILRSRAATAVMYDKPMRDMTVKALCT